MLLPVIGVVKVGYQAAADRYTYIPMMGFFIATAGGLAIALHRTETNYLLRYGILAVSFLAVILLTTVSKQQNAFWQDDETLWTRAIELYPGLAGVAYSNMGTIKFRNSDFSAALIDYNKSLSINPNELTIMEKIGRTYEFMGKPGLALNQYQKIVDTFPEVSYGYILLGDLQYRQKLRDNAKLSYRKAFAVAPAKPATLQRAALADYLDNMLVEANDKLNYLFMISPDNVGAMQLAAKIQLEMGNFDKAKEYALKILSLRERDKFATELLADIEKINNGKNQ